LLGCGNELAPVTQQVDLHTDAVLREIPNDILTLQLSFLRAGATVQSTSAWRGRVMTKQLGRSPAQVEAKAINHDDPDAEPQKRSATPQ
jgi:hypothetical protein